MLLLVGPEINKQDDITISTSHWFYGFWWLLACAKLERPWNADLGRVCRRLVTAEKRYLGEILSW